MAGLGVPGSPQSAHRAFLSQAESALATLIVEQRSDFDFIVRLAQRPEDSLARRYLGFIDALEALLGRHVDVLGDGPIDHPYLRHAVNVSRRVLHDEAPAQTAA